MSDKQPYKPNLWVERPVEDVIDTYSKWADNYDADLTERGYHTPRRIAEALRPFRDELTRPVLDFGCGTGISGLALKDQGFGELHGTDITAEMLEIAGQKQVYSKLWLSQAGELPAAPGAYGAIVAAGVISVGAAPAETLSDCLDALAVGDLLAFSYNDKTLDNETYMSVLEKEIASRSNVVFREHGPHIDDMEMGSDVIILRRR